MGIDASVVGKRSTEYQQHIALGHDPRRHRGAAATEYPGGQGVVVSDVTLGLEGCQDRRTQVLGQIDDRRHPGLGAVADDDGRALVFRQQRHGPGNSLL